MPLPFTTLSAVNPQDLLDGASDRAHARRMSKGSMPTAQILQAQGMVSAQAECSMLEALNLMNQRALTSLHTLDDIAAAVLDRTIRFAE